MRNLSINTWPYRTPENPFHFTVSEMKELKPLMLRLSNDTKYSSELAFENSLAHRSAPVNVDAYVFSAGGNLPAHVKAETPLRKLAYYAYSTEPNIPFYGYKVKKVLRQLSSNVRSQSSSLETAFKAKFFTGNNQSLFGMTVGYTQSGAITLRVPAIIKDEVKASMLTLENCDRNMVLITKLFGYYKRLIKAMLVHQASVFVKCANISSCSKLLVGIELGERVFFAVQNNLKSYPKSQVICLGLSLKEKQPEDVFISEAIADAVVNSLSEHESVAVNLLSWSKARFELRPQIDTTYSTAEELDALKYVTTGSGKAITELNEIGPYKIVGKNNKVIASVSRLSTAIDFVRSNSEVLELF